MTFLTRLCLFPAVLAALLATPARAELTDNPSDREQGERLYSLQVRGILAEKCNSCHGDDPDKIKGELNLLSLDHMLRGGETSNKVLVPGKPDESLLMTAIKWEDPDYEMPPKENDRLTEQQIARVERWIKLGAPWPDAATQKKYIEEERTERVTEAGEIVTTSGGLSDDWTYRRYQPEDVWAFKPVMATEPPGHPETHPVDAFIEEKLRAAKVRAADRADPRTLIRRATADLTGLLPTPTEVYHFLQAHDENPDEAWTTLIDRLLASPHYGERWGQHWLDVARYADTGGFSNDFERSNAWRYRDYVIRSFNEDKPYDQFMKEQIAGDELEPDNPEMRVATGFLRMGPWGTAMVPQPVARQMFLDDVVDNVGQAFLSTPMSCCKCHDHKFDPIPTRDYYGLYATFATTQPAERDAAFLESENKIGFKADKELVQKMFDLADREVKALEKKREDAARAWYKENNKEYLPLNKRKNLRDHEKPPRHCGLDIPEQGTLKVREQDVKIWRRCLERFEPMAQSVYSGPNMYYNAMKLRVEDAEKQQKKKAATTHILGGGSIEAPGDVAQPGVLSALGIDVEVPTGVNGRRLALAEWMANPKNALTSRSFVNRIWQHHFGSGIVPTPNNFGGKGGKPTHPELLDWLTHDFVDNGWQIKRMHKLIMTSEAYRRSVKHEDMEALRNQDPNNHLLATGMPRRLTAEELRDNLLAITGELNRDLGGLPVRPEINMEVALQPRMIQFSIAPAHQPSAWPEQRNRRSIYTYRVRGQADPFLEIFNQPNPNKSCAQRDAAAVSPQAFTLLNSDVMTDRSIALALRLKKEEATLEGQIKRAIHLCFQRQPSDQELERLSAYAKEMVTYHQGVDPKPPVYPTAITRSLVEEFSGKPFEYTEWLPTFEDYHADKKPSDVGPSARALADVCLLLFNTNEFMYLY